MTSRIRRVLTATLGGSALLLVTACGSDPEPAPDLPRFDPTTSSTPEEISVITTDLEAPWSVTFHGDTPLVSERDSARILELDPSGDPREVGTVEGVAPQGEGGLLGIAARGDELFVYYTGSGENRIDRYALTGEPGSLGLGDAENVIDGIPAAGFHNGGRIAFGPDGMLYATTGDAGNIASAQERDSLAGKILRLEPDGSVPDDNPFDGSYTYSYGHRNPQGIAWDDDGTMYSSEFGQNTWDELNVIESGANYGWPEVEGIGESDAFEDPVQQWATDDASPSGIAVFDGAIVMASLKGERLWRIPLDDLGESQARFEDEYGRLRDVVVAPDGAMWVVTNNTDGRGEPRDGDDRIIRVPVGAF